MPNPHPKTDHLSHYQMTPEGDEPLSRRQLQVKLPESLREALDQIPSKKRNQLVRQWIAEGFSRYLQECQERSPSNRSNLELPGQQPL